MKQTIISGIQQIGIGIPNVHEAFAWYRKNFGVNVKVFEEAATADLMLPYTAGKPKERHAILAMSLKGGGGFEIWQPVSKEATKPKFAPSLGDLGIFITKIKSDHVEATFHLFKSRGIKILGGLNEDPRGQQHFYIMDPWDNVFEIVGFKKWFKKDKALTGGCGGSVLGVSNIETSLPFYKEILGYDKIIYDKTSEFEDFNGLEGGRRKYRRVLLTHSLPRKGGFSDLIGPIEIELVQNLESKPIKIFENREWGDAGFIHLCHDVQGMDALKETCEKFGCPFTVDSASSFDMGEAAGRFSYIEDPDGTLFEFVETHKVPLIKSIGWYMDLTKRDPEKPLPKWMVKAMGFNRVKD